jgi:integrase
MRDNLILRGNTYHVRLALPADVRPFFGNRKLLSQSLKTGLQQEAKDRARAILLDWKNQIAEAKQTQASQAEQWREEIADSSIQAQAFHTQNVMSVVTQQKPSPSPHALKAALDDDEAATLLGEAIAGLIRDDVDTSTIAGVMNSFIGLFQGDQQERIAAATALNDFIKQADLQRATNKYGLTPVEQAEASCILANPKTYKPKSPITRTMIDSFAIHLATQIKTEKTRDRLKQSVQRFSDYLTSEGKPLTFDTVHSFLGTLPAARQTRANYLWAGRAFWKWANKYQPAFRDQFNKQPCPFDGHELPKTGEAAGRKRLAFSKQEIEALHRKAVEKSSTALVHLIQFAAYTGARLEEIGRIKPEHTIFDSNHEPIGFKITESKTDAGVRDMPLHPALVPLFKELSANALQNDGFLFPGGHNKYGNRLDGLSKQFGRLKAKDFGKDHTFHSIRHSVTTLLHQEGVSIEVLPYILGHETGAFTLAQYSKGPSFEQKAQAIALLEYNF